MLNCFRFTRTFFALLLTSFVFACSREAEVAIPAEKPVKVLFSRDAVRSTAQLKKILTAGQGTNEVIAKFGFPDHVMVFDSHLRWEYNLSPFPADDEMKGTRVIGVALFITNGAVADWGCSYDGTPTINYRSDAERVPQEQVNDKAFLKLFVVEDKEIPDSTFINTKSLPRLGFVSKTPSFVTDKLKSVSLQEQSISFQNTTNKLIWEFLISFTEDDAAKFSQFTKTNLLKQILITIGDQPLAAPTILAPIDSGVVAFQCDDRAIMELSKKQFARIKQVE